MTVPGTLTRRLALAVPVVAAATALTSCGFNYPTDRPYTPAAGINYTDTTVDILNAAIVSKQPNAGTLVASLSNDSTQKTITMTGISGDGSAVGVVSAPKITLRPGQLVNLADQGGVTMDGTFSAGQYVPLTVTFDNGQTASLEVPVVDDSGQWAGLDHATPSASPSGSPTASVSPSEAPSS